MTATRILVVRHAQSEWNAAGRWQGWGDPPLSELGRAQACEAAGRLSGFSGTVYSSDLHRARETAEILASELDLGAVRTEAGLREIHVGDWTGHTMAEIEEKFPEDFAHWKSGTMLAFANGESREVHQARLIEGMHRIAAANAGGEVLAVTHGGSLSCLERMLDAHTGSPTSNLGGRWFEVSDAIAVASDRLNLITDPETSDNVR